MEIRSKVSPDDLVCILVLISSGSIIAVTIGLQSLLLGITKLAVMLFIPVRHFIILYSILLILTC